MRKQNNFLLPFSGLCQVEVTAESMKTTQTFHIYYTYKMTFFLWYLCQAEVTAEVQKLKEANKQLDADLSAARQEASSQVSFAEYSLFHRALS